MYHATIITKKEYTTFSSTYKTFIQINYVTEVAEDTINSKVTNDIALPDHIQ